MFGGVVFFFFRWLVWVVFFFFSMVGVGSVFFCGMSSWMVSFNHTNFMKKVVLTWSDRQQKSPCQPKWLTEK